MNISGNQLQKLVYRELTLLELPKPQLQTCSDVLANYQLIVSETDCDSYSHVQKDVLHNIVSLYIRVRSFSYAKDIVQQYKIKAKQRKSKSLRKEISRSCKQNEEERKE